MSGVHRSRLWMLQRLWRNHRAALVNLVCPDSEIFQDVGAERGCDGDIRRVAPARDEYSSNSAHVVSRIENVPFAAEVNFDPRGVVRDAIGRRGSDVAEISRAIARRN